jgi:hypothetical protein
MIARSLDVYTLAKLLLETGKRPYATVARELEMSASEFHAAVHRLAEAGLVDPESRKPKARAVQEFLLQGVRYVFPAKRGPVSRGLPTSYAAPPLVDLLASSEENVPVWPYPEGVSRGYSIEPLHPSAPQAARKDPALYEILALIDALREGMVRERQLAEAELRRRIQRS